MQPESKWTSSSLPELWDKIKLVLARELSDQSFKTWFYPVEVVSVTDDRLCLGVPDNYFGQWLKTHYQEILANALDEVVGRRLDINYQVLIKKETSKAPLDPTARASQNLSTTNPQNSQRSLSSFNHQYVFDNFVVGPGNRFAYAATLAVCEAPAKQYNPLFIYGSVGLGKTHLMQSLAQETLLRYPDFKVLYISSEKFTNQLISAIQTRSTSQFRNKYRNLDLLLIDDIHFIAEKESTQEEFFHTFNTLYDSHKQIVVSSDRPPKEIPGLEERLVSRFGWGLVTDIQAPDFETRVAILKKKMERETVVVPDDVLYFIANKIRSNIRELEGALIRVVAYCSLTRQELSLRLAQDVLKDSLREEERRITIDKIQRIVSDYFGLKVSDLRAKTRSRSVAHPRQVAMYLVRTLTHHSLPEIGEYFGGRDHTTVLHSYNKVKNDLVKDPRLNRSMEEIEELLKK
ncbi:MAG: chromosomal replication initiator protein DnaA [Candidatus Omnitrophica bacterium]|nr:chromosomal replication initiator protein DnaA [Candidatus Omnitrophota bacterium]